MSKEHIAEALDKFIKDDGFNGSIHIVQNGEAVLSKGYGYSVIEHKILNTANTKFGIGSISKSFTALLILICEEKNLLSTDDLIIKYFKEAPTEWNSITIQQAITHTAGFIHTWECKEFFEKSMTHVSYRDAIDFLKPHPLLNKPGAEFHYSGLGYFILTYIIEELLEISYEEAIQKYILTPLEMRDSGCGDYRKVLNNHASGYAIVRNAVMHDDHVFLPILMGGGNLYSTVEDLAKYDVGLNNKTLISDVSYKKIYNAVKNNYAYGWYVELKNDREMIYHGGNLPGFNNFILRIPSEKTSIIALSNLNRGIRKKEVFRVSRNVSFDLLEIMDNLQRK
ncbi:MAG: hypothetical protein COA79_07220 [Planctomycetota bacterium]|nr:MAG: hypothetical protein COA79_07220 [Planctomycetota bacterium]